MAARLKGWRVPVARRTRTGVDNFRFDKTTIMGSSKSFPAIAARQRRVWCYSPRGISAINPGALAPPTGGRRGVWRRPNERRRGALKTRRFVNIYRALSSRIETYLCRYFEQRVRPIKAASRTCAPNLIRFWRTLYTVNERRTRGGWAIWTLRETRETAPVEET